MYTFVLQRHSLMILKGASGSFCLALTHSRSCLAEYEPSLATTPTSDVPARLGLKAAALAWLSTAQAFEICRPGQSRQLRLALARLWPKPRPVEVKCKYIYTRSYSVN